MTGRVRKIALDNCDVLAGEVEPPHPSRGPMRAWAEDAASQIDRAERRLDDAEDEGTASAQAIDEKRHAIAELRRAIAYALAMSDAPRKANARAEAAQRRLARGKSGTPPTPARLQARARRRAR